MNDITQLDSKIKEFTNRVQVFKDDDSGDWRPSNPGMTCVWGKSDHIQSFRVLLVIPTDNAVRESDAVDSNDYFMLQIIFQNSAFQASWSI